MGYIQLIGCLFLTLYQLTINKYELELQPTGTYKLASLIPALEGPKYKVWYTQLESQLRQKDHKFKLDPFSN